MIREKFEKLCTPVYLGTFFVLLSAFIFSLMTFIVRAAGDRGIPSYQMMVIRCILQTCYSCYICLWMNINPFGPKDNRFWPFMRGLVGPFGESSFFFGATHIRIADATVLMFSSAIWTPFIAKIMLKEPFRAIYWAAIISGFLGVICVAQPKFIFDYLHSSDDDSDAIADNNEDDKAEPGSLNYTLGAMVCVFGAIVASTVYAIIRKTGGQVHYQVLVFYYGLVGTPTSIFLMFLFQEWVFPDLQGWILLLIIGGCGCLGHTTLNKGAQMIDASRTSVLRNADIGFVLLWQVILLREIPTGWSIVGVILICTSTLIGALTKQKAPLPIEENDMDLSKEINEIELETIEKQDTAI